MKLRQKQRPTKQRSANIKNLITAVTMATALVVAPKSSVAEEIYVDGEVGVKVGLPVAKKCPNPFQYQDGGLRLSKGKYKVDSHGHLIPADPISSKECIDRHPSMIFGLFYRISEHIPGEDHHEEKHDEEEEHSEQVHSLRAQISIDVIRDILALTPSLQLVLGHESAFGAGVNIAAHPAQFHELLGRTSVTFSAHGLASWQVGAEYSATLFSGPPVGLSLGAGCMVEGHENEIHGGCGPLASLTFASEIDGIPTSVSLFTDTAFWQDFFHFHAGLVLTIAAPAGHGGH